MSFIFSLSLFFFSFLVYIKHTTKWDQPPIMMILSTKGPPGSIKPK